MSTLVNMAEDEETVAVDMTMVSSVNIEGKWNFFKALQVFVKRKIKI